MTAPEEEELRELQIRCIAAEKVLTDCYEALELVPLRAIEQGQNWMPSEITLRTLKRIKNALATYIMTYMEEHEG